MSWFDWQNFAYGVLLGALGGAGAALVNHVMTRKMRRRRLEAYKSCLRTMYSIQNGDQLGALTHIVAALTLLENRDVETLEEYLEDLGFKTAKVRDPEMP